MEKRNKKEITRLRNNFKKGDFPDYYIDYNVIDLYYYIEESFDDWIIWDNDGNTTNADTETYWVFTPDFEINDNTEY